MIEQVKNKNQRGRDALKPILWGALLFSVLLLIDMVTKIVADAYLERGEVISIIPGYLELCISYNEGMAFSMGSNAPMPAKVGVVALTGVMFIGMSIFYCTLDKRRTWLRYALVFVVAGGVGNFIDRTIYLLEPTVLAGVRDMVRLKIFVFDFGVCNFADFFIVGGAIALMLALFFFDGAAVYPLTKKYKALAKEMEEKEEAKKAEKQAKK